MRGAFFAVLGLVLSVSGFAKQYTIKTGSGLNGLVLKPGDEVVLEPGDWSNQQLVFKGNGTERQPIKLREHRAGKTMLTAHSTLIIDGTWLVVEGLNFSGGGSGKNDVVVFSQRSSNCRFTNSAIISYNFPDDKNSDHWISVYGDHNRVDHCLLRGKTNKGSMLSIKAYIEPNHDLIDHNYFGPDQETETNIAESIEIGSHKGPATDFFAMIEKNIFFHNKGNPTFLADHSQHCTIRDNLFYECKGTLVLGQSNYASVYGNYFIGNRVPGTGGISMAGGKNKVYNNYFQGLNGKGAKAVVVLMNSAAVNTTTSYPQVTNARVLGNTIISCTEPFNIGFGADVAHSLSPQKSIISENTIIDSGSLLTTSDMPDDTEYAENLVDSTFKGSVPHGFEQKNLKYNRDKYGIWKMASSGAFKSEQMVFGGGGEKKESSTNPFYKNDDIGPDWIETDKIFTAKEQYN